MKVAALVLMFAACVDSEDPQVASSTQAMMREQPGETIPVHSCPPGSIEHEGGSMCYSPSENLPPHDEGWRGNPWHGGDWPPRGADGGGDGGDGPIATPDPNVFIHYKTIGGTLCRCACLVLSAAVCATIADACATATVFTFGGVAVPCATLLRLCLYGGSQAASQFCSDYVCPE